MVKPGVIFTCKAAPVAQKIKLPEQELFTISNQIWLLGSGEPVWSVVPDLSWSKIMPSVNPPERDSQQQGNWASIIAATKRPLGIIALVILSLGTVLGGAILAIPPAQRITVVIIAAGCLVGMGVVVLLLAAFRPSAVTDTEYANSTPKPEASGETTGDHNRASRLRELWADITLVEDVRSLTAKEFRIIRALLDETEGRRMPNYRTYYANEIEFLCGAKGWIRSVDDRYRLTPSGKRAAAVYLADLLEHYLKQANTNDHIM